MGIDEDRWGWMKIDKKDKIDAIGGKKEETVSFGCCNIRRWR